MDFDGPAPFVVGDRGGTTSVFGDALTIPIAIHHRLPNMTAPRKDANTRLPRTAIACVSTNISTFLSNKSSFALKTTLFYHSRPHERCASRHFRSTTRPGARMRRCTLVLEGSANTLLPCSDLNGAQHEQPSALHPILQPRHTAIFLQ